MSINPHAGDHGYDIEIVKGGTVAWADIQTVTVRLQKWPGLVTAALPVNVTIDRANARILWRPVAGDLSEPGMYRVLVTDVTGGMQMVIADYLLTVDSSF